MSKLNWNDVEDDDDSWFDDDEPPKIEDVKIQEKEHVKVEQTPATKN